MLTADLADTRAAFRRELVRLAARPLAGGPMDATREGSLLAFFDWREEAVEVTAELLERLRALPSGAGVEAVKACMGGAARGESGS